MVYEALLAETLGVAAAGTAQRITRLLERFRLPLERPHGAGVADLIEAMRGDKKVRGGEIRFALPKEIGAMHGDARHGWTVAVAEERIAKVLS
jgi:3-dehydroquinate synthase